MLLNIFKVRMTEYVQSKVEKLKKKMKKNIFFTIQKKTTVDVIIYIWLYLFILLANHLIYMIL